MQHQRIRQANGPSKLRDMARRPRTPATGAGRGQRRGSAGQLRNKR
jgi:hypothetical protein